jgi:hypothetical protein
MSKIQRKFSSTLASFIIIIVPNCKILLLLLSKVSDKNNKTIGLLIAKLAQLLLTH